MEKTIRMKLKIKDCDKVFDEELGPGVIASQECTFNGKEKEFESPMFAMRIIEEKDKFMRQHVEVDMEAI